MAINKNIVFLQVLLVAFFSLMIQSREITTEQQALLDQLPADQKDSILQKMNQANQLQDEIEEVFETESTLIKRPERDEEDSKYENVRFVSLDMIFFSIHHQHLFKPVPHQFPLIMFLGLVISRSKLFWIKYTDRRILHSKKWGNIFTSYRSSKPGRS